MAERVDWTPIPVEFPAVGRMVSFEVSDRRLLLCNAEGAPYVIDATCPHARVALGDGVLRGCILECPLHGGKLDVRDGSAVAPPIRTGALTYRVRSEHGTLEVGVPYAR